MFCILSDWATLADGWSPVLSCMCFISVVADKAGHELGLAACVIFVSVSLTHL